MLSRLTTALLAFLVATLAVLPTGAAHRCLRMGVAMPAVHACCPPSKVETDVEPDTTTTTLGLPCCETVAGRTVSAQLPASRSYELLAAPAVVSTLQLATATVDPQSRYLAASPAWGRPPGERLRQLSSILRI